MYYIADIDKEKFLTVGEFIKGRLNYNDEKKISRRALINRMKSIARDDNVCISENFVSQWTTDREKVPLSLIGPLIDVIVHEYQPQLTDYYKCELLRTYLPSSLHGSLNSKQTKIRNRVIHSACLKIDASPVFNNPTDLYRALSSAHSINRFLDDLRSKGINFNSKDKLRFPLKSSIWDTSEIIRFGESPGIALWRAQNGQPLLLKSKYDRNGKVLPQERTLSILHRYYKSNGGNDLDFIKHLEQYDSRIDGSDPTIIKDGESYLDVYRRLPIREVPANTDGVEEISNALYRKYYLKRLDEIKMIYSPSYRMKINNFKALCSSQLLRDWKNGVVLMDIFLYCHQFREKGISILLKDLDKKPLNQIINSEIAPYISQLEDTTAEYYPEHFQNLIFEFSQCSLSSELTAYCSYTHQRESLFSHTPIGSLFSNLIPQHSSLAAMIENDLAN